MTIPVGYGQINWKMGGSALPTGAEVTMGIDISAALITQAEVANLAIEGWDAEIAPWISDGFELTSVLVKYGPDATGPSIEIGASVNGEHAGVGAPPNVAYLLKKITADGGRAGRGRLYVPGVPEAQVDSAGLLTSTVRNGLDAGWEAFAAAFVAEAIGFVVLHQDGSPISTPSPITSLVVDNRVATQRQRLRR